ncbi:lysine-specific demethylase 8 [Clonorchis sinensis]|uniref:Lysine-specific demethylase 8 n=1 Tax=Clonorchis sinensis TaxID=79923 RepID=H2KP05_CLOSI|nr:lysine-specific demethylase 8 [Clonorchis sinensis]
MAQTAKWTAHDLTKNVKEIAKSLGAFDVVRIPGWGPVTLSALGWRRGKKWRLSDSSSDVSQTAPTPTDFLQLLSPYESDLGPLVFEDFSKLLAQYEFQERSVDEFREQSRFILEYVWEKLHTGHWKDVPLCWRTVYAAIRLLRALYVIAQLKLSFPSDMQSMYLQRALEDLDYSLLMGHPIFEGVAAELAAAVHRRLSDLHGVHSPPNEDSPVIACPVAGSPSDNPNLRPLDRIFRPSIEKFLDLMRIGQPFILTGAMTHWPACQSGNPHAWTVNYWRRCFGYRIVPVEIGRKYTDESWGQELMSITRFIDQFVFPSSDSCDMKSETPSRPIGYLAQHQLFLQIPELGYDVHTPDYCMVSGEESSDVSDVDINVWFGPANTISPLHHDSDRANLLTQVSGYKYVVLFTASETPLVYPHPEKMLSNTSQVDVEHPDLAKFPQFALAQGFHGILSPGEMVFIPPRCWHYIRSLTTSFSVNFWWNVVDSLIPPWPYD